jgi:hypothetical protein
MHRDLFMDIDSAVGRRAAQAAAEEKAARAAQLLTPAST